MKTEELRVKVKESVDQLSPITLRIAADFVAYLLDKESEEATDELLEIPDFMEAFEKSKKNLSEGKGRNWREIRQDVKCMNDSTSAIA